MQQKELTCNDKRLHYRIEGDGEAIVLVHGFMESSAIWEAFGTELARNFLCIAPDLPGHGQSGNLSEVHTMTMMADCLKAILDHEGIQRCILVGHSMGGYVSLDFSAHYTSRVAGLVLFHSSALPDSEEARRNRERTIEVVRQNHHGFIAQFIPSLFAEFNAEPLQTEIETLMNQARAMAPESIIAAQAGMKERPGYLELLTTLTCPVLFIGGKHDSRIPADKLMAQAMLPWHSEVLLLGNAGHMGYLEAPAQTFQALRYFCERVYDF